MSVTVRTFLHGMSRAFAVADSESGRTILVDAGHRTGVRRLQTALSNAGIDPESVSLIVLTHAHTDHTAALADLKALTGAPLMSSAPAAAALTAGRDEELVPRTRMGRFLTRFSPEKDSGDRAPIAVEHIVSGETDLAPFGITGVVLPTSGHTGGSVSLLTADGDAVIGDLLMKFLPGRPGLSFLSNDPDALDSSLRMLLDRGARRFHLAHGGTVRRSAVEKVLSR